MLNISTSSLHASRSTSSFTQWGGGLLLIVLLIVLGVGLGWWVQASNPYRVELVSQTYALSQLTPAQVQNIQLASHALNGKIIRPGETFSFNQTVGPRTSRQGYRAAPVYVNQQTLQEPGGGICVLSSLLYQLALRSNMRVVSRTPHQFIPHTIPPGLDATVNWPNVDLAFQNPFTFPVQLQSIPSHSPKALLQIRLLGSQPLPLTSLRPHTARHGQQIYVQMHATRPVSLNSTKKPPSSFILSRDAYQAHESANSIRQVRTHSQSL